ncbi:hypothetical protein CUR178_01115 [Leishmania enriettii]|uniref:Uncharacterized protein n=1 Tax=Leishmania enriettii TaxID=5663 RepID=A0A836FQY4_LEIEN|nr:hypothetical protein CUR178_01115 [Leishmania enriettii]
MQLDDWSAYRETVLYSRELALLFPSLCSGSLSEHFAAEVSSLSAHPSSLTSLASVKQVEAPLLTQWLVAATAAPVAYHCSSAADDAGSVDHAAAVVATRWTRLLGIWIGLRLEHLRSASEGVRAREEAKEMERYRQYFVPLAWPILDRSLREWLASRFCALAERREARQPAGNTSCASDAAASSACGTIIRRDEEGEQEFDEVCTRAMEATQRVAREYLRISWQALHPSSVPAMVDSKLKRLSTHASRHNGNETDCYMPKPAVVHTYCLGDLLQALARLRLPPQQQQHPDCGAAPWLTLVQNALLHIGYDLLTKVRASLIERCYYLVPAAVDYESCLLLCEAMLRESAVLQTSEKELTRTQSILRLTLQSLLQSAFALYQHSILGLLVDYKKKSARLSSADSTPRLVKVPAPMAPANPLAALQEAPKTRRASDASFLLEPPTYRGATGRLIAPVEMRLSEPAFAVLVEVLEPTCDLLQRYPAGQNALSAISPACADERDQGAAPDGHTASKGGLLAPSPPQQRLVRRQPQGSTALDVRRELVSFLEAKLSDCFADAAAGSGAAAKEAQRQATVDAHLTATYLATYGPQWE